MTSVLIRKGDQDTGRGMTMWGHGERTTPTCPGEWREEDPFVTPWLWVSSLQDCEKVSFCYSCPQSVVLGYRPSRLIYWRMSFVIFTVPLAFNHFYTCIKVIDKIKTAAGPQRDLGPSLGAHLLALSADVAWTCILAHPYLHVSAGSQPGSCAGCKASHDLPSFRG